MIEAKTVTLEEKLAYSTDNLPLSIRAYGVIRTLKLQTVKDLVNADVKLLQETRNCGKKTIAEIIAILKMMGLKMMNSDGMFSEEVIDNKIASIRSYLEEIRKPIPKIETSVDRRIKELRQQQIQVMQMRTEGVSFNAIGEKIGRTSSTARVNFFRFGRSLVWEAKKRRLPVEDILAEYNIPLAAIDLIRKAGIAMS